VFPVWYQHHLHMKSKAISVVVVTVRYEHHLHIKIKAISVTGRGGP
jgi:hypothetical protein